MEPEPILPAPVGGQSVEGSSQDVSLESMGIIPAERVPSAPEQLPSAPVAGVAAQDDSTNVVAPTAVSVPTDDSTDPAATNSPAIADDVDVIEKEWVDKAKQIVTSTKDNPYQQEKEVSKLQADYLMKRYGKKVKLVD